MIPTIASNNNAKASIVASQSSLIFMVLSPYGITEWFLNFFNALLKIAISITASERGILSCTSFNLQMFHKKNKHLTEKTLGDDPITSILIVQNITTQGNKTIS